MIDDLKLGIKMLRYAHGRTGTIICAILFGLLGFLICAGYGLFTTYGTFNGGFLMLMVPTWLIQLLYSLNVCDMVVASPVRRRMQTTVPAILNCVCTLIVYAVVLVIQGIWIAVRPELITPICNELTCMMLLVMVLMVYTAFAYKYFAVSIIGFYFFFFILYVFNGVTHQINLWNFGSGIVSYVAISLLGVVAIVLGGYLQYLASLMIYKRPMSKAAQPATLRKYL